MTVPAGKRDVLRRVRMFAQLDDVDADAVVGVIKARKGAPGDVLVRQGDVGATMMIVADGQLSASVAQSDGGEVEIARFGPGDTVGEMTFLDPCPRSATVRATKATIVYELGRDALETLRRDAPRAASAIIRSVIRDVTQRLRAINARIEAQIDGAVGAQGPVSARSAPLGTMIDRVRGGG